MALSACGAAAQQSSVAPATKPSALAGFSLEYQNAGYVRVACGVSQIVGTTGSGQSVSIVDEGGRMRVALGEAGYRELLPGELQDVVAGLVKWEATAPKDDAIALADVKGFRQRAQAFIAGCATQVVETAAEKNQRLGFQAFPDVGEFPKQ